MGHFRVNAEVNAEANARLIFMSTEISELAHSERGVYMKSTQVNAALTFSPVYI